MLMCTSLTVVNWNWTWDGHNPQQVGTSQGYKVTAQIRHRMREAKATLRRMYAIPLPSPGHFRFALLMFCFVQKWIKKRIGAFLR